LRAFCEAEAVKVKDLVGLLRCGLSGRLVTPGIFDTLVLLGKDESLQRLALAEAWS